MPRSVLRGDPSPSATQGATRVSLQPCPHSCLWPSQLSPPPHGLLCQLLTASSSGQSASCFDFYLAPDPQAARVRPHSVACAPAGHSALMRGRRLAVALATVQPLSFSLGLSKGEPLTNSLSLMELSQPSSPAEGMRVPEHVPKELCDSVMPTLSPNLMEYESRELCGQCSLQIR